jgi:predicted nucleic acid-binding protein
MIIDTSGWVDYSRDAASPIRSTINAALVAREAMTVDIVRLELLAGVPAETQLSVRRILAGCRSISQLEWADVDSAAELFQRCRRRGETIRSPNDCLIAAIAVRVGVPVLHRDRDFDAIARHSELQAVRA